MSEDDRTRAMRSPGERRPLPPRNDRLRAAGAPAHQFPQGADDAPRSSSRVYGRRRSGSSPVRPLSGGSGRASEPPGPRGPREPRGPRRRIRGGTIFKIIAALLVVLVLSAAGLLFWIDGRLGGLPGGVLDDYKGRPDDTPGTNWLLVGSDSREGLTKRQRRKLATGNSEGRRTDSMMLLHLPEGGDKPTLVSLPRDSAVSIPGHGRNKLNAAYAIGGPRLLVQTVETVTGLRVDNYMEIGFAGFVDIVDAVGGVEINVRAAVNDPKAGLKLKKGTQTLNGAQALGYVRTRKGGALPDYERTKRQRQFLSAVVKKAASPGTLINPFTSIPLAMSATEAVAVDEDTGVFDMLSLGLAMGDSPVTTVVPFGGTEIVAGGQAVKWDRAKALELFDALAADKPVPKEIIDAGN
ncbi:MAG TPA: LCP family protein [Nonomuraea sp.]|uniref:LCP family protein n=1 Tax=Nonomuraea sp. NPDC049649 TaxID=3155776 RepID=UPI002B8A4EC8|nr:LCP family protein [Nonomuraea sp.]